ncbi:MAG: ATP-binding cassette domain-containing protein [Syntrophales bacterium]|nr:ATP-binding cassette domain-containing protein [Syntrophales bacterium]
MIQLMATEEKKKTATLQEKVPMETTQKIVLTTKGLRKSFGGQVVLDDITLDLKQGQVVLLKGENGSGKTTLINILTGNLEPDAGELHISINGHTDSFAWPKNCWKDLNPFDRFTPERLAWEGIGRAWQDIRLFSTMTTLENVTVASQNQKGENPIKALVSTNAKKEETINREASTEWLKRFGLKDRLDSSCDKISLGQMKRVAIARAIQAGAKVLFLDEPLSGLDKQGVSEIMEYLESLVKGATITLVIVEHVFNIPTILKLADTVWKLDNGKITVARACDFKERERPHKQKLHSLLSAIAGEKGTITSRELPGGARCITATPAEFLDSPTVLEVKDLSVKRGIRTVIDGLSISCQKGRLSILEAPNGWGKSTLLDAIAGVQPMKSGRIILHGKELGELPTYRRIRAGLAYLRANERAFSSLTVTEQRKIAHSNSGIFNGSLNGSRKGSCLSGGENQKVLIESLPEADAYLLDEPMIGLDEGAISTFSDRVENVVRTGKSVLITTPRYA